MVDKTLLEDFLKQTNSSDAYILEEEFYPVEVEEPVLVGVDLVFQTRDGYYDEKITVSLYEIMSFVYKQNKEG